MHCPIPHVGKQSRPDPPSFHGSPCIPLRRKSQADLLPTSSPPLQLPLMNLLSHCLSLAGLSVWNVWSPCQTPIHPSKLSPKALSFRKPSRLPSGHPPTAPPTWPDALGVGGGVCVGSASPSLGAPGERKGAGGLFIE